MGVHLKDSKTGDMKDWTAFTRAWNVAAFDNLSRHLGKVLTFKQVAHLKDYDKSLAKAAGKMHGAAMAAGHHLDHHQQSPPSDPGHMDLAAALKVIMTECLQQPPQGSTHAVSQLPPILLELLTQVAGTASVTAGAHTAGEASTSANAMDNVLSPSHPTASGMSPAVAAAATAGVMAVAAAARHAPGQSAAQAVQNAFSQLRAPTGVVHLSRKTGKPTQPGRGKGFGGEGGSKVCVPCTLVKYKLGTADEARSHHQQVTMTKDHQPGGAKPCPYCKCKECKAAWSHKRPITSYEFPLKCNCKGD
jgi:hypothetical protein